MPGEADVKYLDGDFRVVRPGAFVRCAVTGVAIPLEELRYWSVDLQEAYATPEAVAQRQGSGYARKKGGQNRRRLTVATRYRAMGSQLRRDEERRHALPSFTVLALRYRVLRLGRRRPDIAEATLIRADIGLGRRFKMAPRECNQLVATRSSQRGDHGNVVATRAIERIR